MRLRPLAAVIALCVTAASVLAEETQGHVTYEPVVFDQVNDRPMLTMAEQVDMIREAQRTGDWSAVAKNRDAFTAFPE